MIYGIGTDVVQMERVQKIFDRHGERFVEHLLMPQELAAFRDHRRPVRFLAMRFAAKEAIVKALGRERNPAEARSISRGTRAGYELGYAPHAGLYLRP